MANTAATQSAASPATRKPSQPPFTFGFIGDTPYTWLDERALDRVMTAMAAEPLAFVLHVGDIKHGNDACTDTLLDSRIARLDACAHPLILTPGDNEWTDCWRNQARDEVSDIPLERLAWLRRRVYARPQSLGQRRMPLEQQGPVTSTPSAIAEGRDVPPRLPENLRWSVGGVRFCTLHVIGSNNGPRGTRALERAWSLRQEANARWLHDTVELALAERAGGLVVALHANLRFERNRADGWRLIRELIIAAARRFAGPMLLLHGDTHWFQEGPLFPDVPALAQLYRVECHGSPFTSSWVSIHWNPAAAPGLRPFTVTARSV